MDIDIRIETLGCYRFPFIAGSSDANAVINDEITIDQYLRDVNNFYAMEYNGTRYKYTKKEIADRFNGVIKQQRICYKAALLVLDGKFISINPALRSLGIKV